MNSDGRSAAAMRVRLASGFLIVRNAAITIGARLVIVLIAIAAVPILIDRLGTARFGVLAIAWVVIGYANVFDLGLGRALTKFTAARLGEGRDEEIPKLFWTSVWILAALGICTGGLIVALSSPLATSILEVPEALRSEAQSMFVVLGCTVPFVLVSAALRGSLEARQRFDLTNAVAVPLSILSYFGPVVVSLFTPSLPLVVLAVAASRVIATGINFALCFHVDAFLRRERRLDSSVVSPLLRFGGWITVAAIVTPLMLTLDRFVVGSVLSVTAVAYYATPYEAAKQMLLVSSSFSAVLFPGFSANVEQDRGNTERLFSLGTRATMIGLFPLVLVAAALSYEILSVWVNEEFAVQSSAVLQLLAIGILINGLAFVAYALIQSIRPAVIALVACVELPSYMAMLWVLLELDGIRGAAIAFVVRVAIDTTVLYWLTHRLSLIRAGLLFSLGRLAAACVGVAAVGILLPNTTVRVIYVIGILSCFLPIAWNRILNSHERTRVMASLARLSNRVGPRGRAEAGTPSPKGTAS